MRRAVLAAFLALAACGAPSAEKERDGPTRDRPRDPGGNVALRAAEIALLRAAGAEKRVEGECLSACTMYLGLPTACFDEDAVLGFHGPRLAWGLDITPAQFEAVTQLMAAHYPPRVAQWFMDEARHSRRMSQVPAADLIARGEARACED